MDEAITYNIRPARSDEIPALNNLIRLSADILSRDDYTALEIEAAIKHVFGVDSELVEDGTYYTVEYKTRTVGCGGWSKRKTLFGGDSFNARESGFLNPAQDAAKIRAFFVHPFFARKGIGSALLTHCETEARNYGFKSVELMSTLPGLKFYQSKEYQPLPPKLYETPSGITLEFIPMHKVFT